MPKKIITLLTLGLLFSHTVLAAAPGLTEMSLEELMSVEITSISKTPQMLSKAPASVYVITNEDIHRSGRTTVPDLLRTVPGVQVGQIDASTWGVSIRGFNDRFANKLLVLMDGRSVYTPLFSGTFWNLQDTLFEDIDRIEVVKGPGGTTWGANAVNGVVNIITKSAKDTQGLYAAGGYGTLENGFGDFRYGGKLPEHDVYYRFYKKYYNRNKSFEGQDDWEAGKGGGRVDWDIDSENKLTVQGDFYAMYGYTGNTIRRYKQPVTTGPFTAGFDGPYNTIEDVDTYARGRNVLSKFTHTFSEDSDFYVQMYYDFTYLSNPFVREARDTYDVDARYRFPVEFAGISQEVILGVGYRYTSDETHGSYEVQFNPANRDTDIISWSIQDELRLIPDFMTLWVGSKFENNDYTGFEYQPSARLAIYPDTKNTVWGSITRAVRTPSRADDDVIIHQTQAALIPGVGTGPVDVVITGSDDFESEELLAYEVGLKSQVTENFNADISAFYNEYDNLRAAVFGRTTTNAAVVTTVPSVLQNAEEGTTYGTEISLKYHVNEKVRLKGGYSYLKINLHQAPGTIQEQPGPGSTEADSAEEESPNHQATAGISLDLPWNITYDIEVRYVGELPALEIGEYFVTDMRLAWKPNDNWEVSVVGLNLFEAYHYEFETPAGLDFLGFSRRVRPSVYGKVEARF